VPDIDIEIVAPGIDAVLGAPIELNTTAPPTQLTMTPEPHPPTQFNLIRTLAGNLPRDRRLAFAVWLRRLVRKGYCERGDERRIRDFIAESDCVGWQFLADLNDALRDNIFDLSMCGDCERATFTEDGTSIDDGDRYVCQRCLENNYFDCADCGNYSSNDNEISIEHFGSICRNCYENGEYSQCDRCGNHFHNENTVYDDNTERTYCEAHAPRSGCKPTHLKFEFPALCLPQQSVQNDEIVEVSVAHGDVGAQGIAQIVQHIQIKTSGKWGNYGVSCSEIHDDSIMDTLWQTREGNFPKRLAKHLLIEHHLKLTDELMAEVGNIAKQHTTKPGKHYLSITRDINQDPGEFVNDGSCWWGSESNSRCTFKAMWGFGVRTWSTPGGRDDGGYPVSRAWLIGLKVKEVGDGFTLARTPLTRQTFTPTPELPADAYVLFNPYEIERLPYARMIAGMVGKSYKKLPSFYANMYINSGGVLIAEQSICDATTIVDLGNVSRKCSCGGN
jgi:hypothetical protein